MVLLKSGNLIVNMDRLIAVNDEGHQMTLLFQGGTAPSGDGDRPLPVVIQAAEAQLMRLWLGRMGVHDLKTEAAIFPFLSG